MPTDRSRPVHLRQKLTADERVGITRQYNLADGHARTYPALFWESVEAVARNREIVEEGGLEKSFVLSFFDSLGQSPPVETRRTRILRSASASLEIVANVLRMERLSLVAPQPCFDNLFDIFSRHDIPILLYDASNVQFLDEATAKLRGQHDAALLLVLPNNPTGVSCDREAFVGAIATSQRTSATLIVDASFRAFDAQLCSWDMYELLEESGIRYVVIEDTGKLISSLEMKASTITADPGLFQAVADVYDDMLIGHSPFIVAVLRGIVRDLTGSGIGRIRQEIDRNRRQCAAALSDFFTSEPSIAPVYWASSLLPVSDNELVRRLADRGVAVLPGSKFYFDDQSRSNRHIRIALMRDASEFDRALDVMAEALCALQR